MNTSWIQDFCRRLISIGKERDLDVPYGEGKALALRGLRQLGNIFFLGVFLTLLATITVADESHSRYFEQLRQRALFSLAEAEALARLSADDLPLATRSGLCIELSRTLAEHAGFVSDEQRNELWQRARSTILELLEHEPSNPRAILLNGQLASVFAVEADWLRAEREIRPFDESLHAQAKAACSQAIEQLKTVEKSISEPSREGNVKRSAVGTMSGYELRTLLHQVRWQLGLSYRNRADLGPPGSVERTSDLADAEQTLRRLVGVADEPLQSRTRLLLATCCRLKNESDRALELIVALEKGDPKPSEDVQNEITAERVRLLNDLKRPTEAAELLLKARSQRQRLTGELWYLQSQTLMALREIALKKQQEILADRLAEQIATTISRCEEQVGGYWSRRCRQLWDNMQTAQKYGEELDAMMQQARAAFTAGRTESAILKYAAAEKLAAERGQTELAMELGFTRASILLEQTQFEAAAAEFLRLSSEYALYSRAAKAHLLGAYCLGRLYDEKRTQARREDYSQALDQHLKVYVHDATINDARFLKAQFEEQRLQATLALPLYQQVDAEHARGLEAMAGTARCYETLLRRMKEQHRPTEQFKREAIDRLSQFLSSTNKPLDTWNSTHADIALRLVAILLTPADFRVTLSDLTASSQNRLETIPEAGQAVQCELAESWLARVTSFTERQNSAEVSTELIERLRQRIIPLQIVALAGRGKSIEAERTLKSLSSSPAELLTVIDRLSPFVAAAKDDQRVRIASLQLRAAERLTPQRNLLSTAECDLLDRCLMRAYVSTNQLVKAVEIARRFAERSAKEVETQRELAVLFGEIVDGDANLLAKQCWRRVESLTKAGSEEWLTARLGVLGICARLNQFDEGRKLLQVTKVLYPDLGGESMKAPFAAIDKVLQTEKTTSR